ncbi:DUF185-domain-containing protein [Pseudovirgaria hyperparasitica]|uniref:Protein arginine methyltransferase NDUFAF7 n=1 Tax=Pseudovirgaria hyperparasitica TaxID=470096 RepID=A0A6A6WH29_9PEZI|nr:DUF185-domain-containing protein [Pseudovirgaria hyperparasitica]KAF2761370.1 DUF185-domain-containing protein [Pseudovirgaria hyperparasitica]
MRSSHQIASSVFSLVARRSQRSTQCSRICRRWLSSEFKNRQWSTPLAKMLANAIEATGPITVAAYMRQVLTSPDGGYYTSQTETGRDQFGQKGDFVTSPEISQIFGELIGLWFLTEWMSQGKRSSGVTIMEMGPGRGTLMNDMLRTIQNFEPMASSIEAIYLVEASPILREAQKQLLCGDATMQENDIGFESQSKHLEGVKVIWTEDVRLLPKDANESPFIVAHEFFDALPIHVFQSIEQTADHGDNVTAHERPGTPTTGQLKGPTRQWRELVISPTADPDPLAPDLAKQLPEFELSVSKKHTPHSLYLPETSQRYKALKHVKDAIIEISPESLAYVSEFATRIGGSDTQEALNSAKAQAFSKPTASGAALILDYGTMDTIPTNSLRGIRHHERLSPLASPGAVDVSADVDFVALANAALGASPNVVVHGPMEQGTWLGAMGIQTRAEMLMTKAQSEEEKRRIETGWKRLVDRGPQGMGKIYKAMAIIPSIEGDATTRRPVGFGGDISV